MTKYTLNEQLTEKDREELAQLRSIPDPSARILKATDFMCDKNLHCFTEDGNHCSGWVDSVFYLAGIKMYDEGHRIFVGNFLRWSEFVGNFYSWSEKGTMNGLQLNAGDSIIRFNDNYKTKHHQEIILASTGPDEARNYRVTTVGKTRIDDITGLGTIAKSNLTIKAEHIRVVIRPGATQAWT